MAAQFKCNPLPSIYLYRWMSKIFVEVCLFFPGPVFFLSLTDCPYEFLFITLQMNITCYCCKLSTQPGYMWCTQKTYAYYCCNRQSIKPFICSSQLRSNVAVHQPADLSLKEVQLDCAWGALHYVHVQGTIQKMWTTSRLEIWMRPTIWRVCFFSCTWDCTFSFSHCNSWFGYDPHVVVCPTTHCLPLSLDCKVHNHMCHLLSNFALWLSER